MIDLKGATRAGEWWDYKLVPIVTIYYCTIFLSGQPIAAHLLEALLLLLAMSVCATYVSLLNDMTDVADDLAAGKSNNMAGKPMFRQLLLLLPVLAIGAFFIFLWRDNGPLVACYAAAWLAFALYSIPPVRLKSRGLWGVVADACGAHVFPTAVAVLLAFAATHHPVDWNWFAASLCWTFGYGLRGILWHQRLDQANDKLAGVRTFAVSSPRLAARIGAWLAFPLECIALSLLLWRLGHALPVLALLVYLLLVMARVKQWRLNVTLTSTAPNYHILMQEYYICFFPLAVLAASTLRFPVDGAVIVIHVLLFPQQIIQALGEAWIVVGRPGKRWLQRR